MGIQYIHYGSNTFYPEQLKACTTDEMPTFKPHGLWACRMNPDDDNYFTWKDWYKGEDFHTDALDSHFVFHLADTAKILLLNGTMEPIEPYLKSMYDGFVKKIDVNKLKKDGYDGIELIHGDNYMEIHYSDVFYTWDVDCIVIWNPDVIVVE